MQRKQYPDVPSEFGYWLAGFTDGEGCFAITPARQGRWTIWFRINVREDERDTMAYIATATGLGSVMPIHQGGSPNAQIAWFVCAKAEVIRLAELFDRYPLRAKKARDYAIWRLAVAHWATMPTHYTWLESDCARIGELAEQIKQVRRYVAAA
jgi:hypothetical protein